MQGRPFVVEHDRELLAGLSGQLGRRSRRHLGRRPGADRLLAEVASLLEGYGFEPVVHQDHQVTLRNCPFDTVARAFPDVVCGMNLAVVDGIVTGLRTDAIEARLAPEPGRCCVVIAAADPAPPSKARWPRTRLGG